MRDDFYPPDYLFLPPTEARERIREHRRRLGEDLRILAHPYQRPEVQEIADVVGDGLALARACAGSGARYVLAATVHYAAENAALLGSPGQRVFAADRQAGCPMSDGLDLPGVAAAVDALTRQTGKPVLPLASLTSPIEAKAWTGDRGGWTCASANAAASLTLVRERGAIALFLPDQHLGRSAAAEAGIAPTSVVTWTPDTALDPTGLEATEVLLVDGECHVHGAFRASQIARSREAHPGARVLAHRDARAEVTEKADLVGGHREIEDAVAASADGTALIVASEVHFVDRLRRRHPGREIIELETSFCPTMYMVHLAAVLHTLDHLETGANATVIPPELAAPARAALERMLALD